MKKNAIDKAIDHLESEKAVIQMAIDRLRAQKDKSPARKPKTAKPVAVERTAS